MKSPPAWMAHGIAVAVLVTACDAMAVEKRSTAASTTNAVREQVDGPGAVLTMAQIPKSPLRESLARLSGKALDNALRQLSKKDLLKDAKSLRTSKNGDLYYVCAFESPEPPESAEKIAETKKANRDAVAPAVALASVPIASPPIRHSKPGSSHVLFLDFNGGTISGTDWNLDYGESSWDCRPFSIDGDETTFSATEQQRIVEIWERVAEDYIPYDIDVTTEQPSSWNRYTGHVMITPGTDKNGKQCPHYGWAGIAYLGKYGQSEYSYDYWWYCYSPVWVDSTMSSMDYAYVAEAASHEFGHNLNLSHDGTGSEDYYFGHGSGSVSWFPLMGGVSWRNVSQWSKGEYYNATRTEDDLAIMAGYLGYRSETLQQRPSPWWTARSRRPAA